MASWSGRVARPVPGVRSRWQDTSRQELLKRAAADLVVPHTPEDYHVVGQLSDGFEVTASLVNVVYLSRIRCEEEGSTDCGVSPVALQQALLGLASINFKSTHSKEIIIKYVAPFRGKHSVTTADLKLQETAATSGSVGQATVDVTLRLLQSASGCTSPLYAHERHNTNEVYTGFVNFAIDLPLLQRLHPTHIGKPKKFDARVIRPPDFGKKRLLVFPRGIIICVGSKDPEGMLDAMRRWLGRIEAARTDRLLPKKKRKRDQMED
jgi:hypothetical protein